MLEIHSECLKKNYIVGNRGYDQVLKSSTHEIGVRLPGVRNAIFGYLKPIFGGLLNTRNRMRFSNYTPVK